MTLDIEACIWRNGGTYFVVRETCGGEDGDLLAAGDGVHGVDSRNTSLDHLFGVNTRIRVNRTAYTTRQHRLNTTSNPKTQRTVDVEIVLSEYFRSVVDRVTRTVEDAAQHVLRDGELHRGSGKLDVCSFDVDAGGAFEDLHDRFVSLDFEDLPAALGAVGEGELHDLVVGGELRRAVSVRDR